MNEQNYKAGKITAIVVGIAALIIGVIPKSAAGGMECGSILAPGKQASFPGCSNVNTVPAGLLWVVILAAAGVFVYLSVLESKANNEKS